VDERERELERRWLETGAAADEEALLWTQHRRGVRVDLAAHLGHEPARRALDAPQATQITTLPELHDWARELETWGAGAPFRAALGWLQLGLKGIRIESTWFGESALGHVEGLLQRPTQDRQEEAKRDLPRLAEERSIYVNNARQDVFAGNFSVVGAGAARDRLEVVAGICGATAVDLLGACLWGIESLADLRATAWDAVALATYPDLFGARDAYAGSESLGERELQALLAALQRDACERLVPWALGRVDPLAARSPRALRTYRPDQAYRVGERISHSKFGVGEVIAVRGQQAEVEFETAKRTLACAREA